MRFLIGFLVVILFSDAGFSVSGLQMANPEPPLLSFNVMNNGSTCLKAEFASMFTPPAPAGGNGTATPIIFNGTIDMSKSSCGPTETLSIMSYDGTVGMTFSFTSTNTSVMLTTLMLNYNSITYSSNSSSALFTVPKGNTYRCNSGIEAILSDGLSPITVNLKSVRFNGFRAATGNEFEPESLCAGDEAASNKMIPIIIAIVLAGMVVIMLVGYIILRKKENKSVYQTV